MQPFVHFVQHLTAAALMRNLFATATLYNVYVSRASFCVCHCMAHKLLILCRYCDCSGGQRTQFSRSSDTNSGTHITHIITCAIVRTFGGNKNDKQYAECLAENSYAMHIINRLLQTSC